MLIRQHVRIPEGRTVGVVKKVRQQRGVLGRGVEVALQRRSKRLACANKRIPPYAQKIRYWQVCLGKKAEFPMRGLS